MRSPLTELRVERLDTAGIDVRSWEWRPKRERVRCRSMRREMLEPIQSFRDRRVRADRDPPQREDRRFHGLEPLTSATQYLDVIALVDNTLQRFERLPDDMLMAMRTSLS
jgi:hypothetical protein